MRPHTFDEMNGHCMKNIVDLLLHSLQTIMFGFGFGLVFVLCQVCGGEDIYAMYMYNHTFDSSMFKISLGIGMEKKKTHAIQSQTFLCRITLCSSNTPTPLPPLFVTSCDVQM